MENTETQVSLDLIKACVYISQEKYLELKERSEEIGRMLDHMVQNPGKFIPKK